MPQVLGGGLFDRDLPVLGTQSLCIATAKEIKTSYIKVMLGEGGCGRVLLLIYPEQHR
jgi:hypothetical protein